MPLKDAAALLDEARKVSAVECCTAAGNTSPAASASTAVHKEIAHVVRVVATAGQTLGNLIAESGRWVEIADGDSLCVQP